MSRIKGFALWFWFGYDASTTEMDPVIRKFECGHLYMDFINEVTFVLGMRHKDTHTICPGLACQLPNEMLVHTHTYRENHTLVRENASLFISILYVMRSRPMCHWAWAVAQLV